MRWFRRALTIGLLATCVLITMPASGQPPTAVEIQMILGEHNAARCQVSPPAASMPALVWDNALAQVAQSWADRGAFAHNAARETQYTALGGSGSVGESIAFGSSMAQIVKLWVDERNSYRYGPLTVTNASSGAHYTQVVWAATTRLGCGVGKIASQLFLVCNYSRAGNFVDQLPYKAGTGVNAACGGSPPPSTTMTPTAAAGPDQTVEPGDEVTLDGSESHDPEGAELLYSWMQVGGPAVTLDSSDSDTATFSAPNVFPSSSVLTFELVVSDGVAISVVDSIEVRVLNGTLPAGRPGPAAQADPQAPAGPSGPLGSGVPSGTVIYLTPSAPAPTGFTFIGRSSFLVQRPNGRVDLVTLHGYRKN